MGGKKHKHKMSGSKKKRRKESIARLRHGASELALTSEEDLRVLVAKADLLYNANDDLVSFLEECLPAVQATIGASDSMVQIHEEEDEEEEEDSMDLIRVRKTKAKRKSFKSTAPHPARKLVAEASFVDIILKVCKALCIMDRSHEACDIVCQIEGWGPGAKAIVQLQQKALEKVDEIKMMAAGIAYSCKEFDMAYKFVRFVVSQRPYSFVHVHLLNRIINKLDFHSKCVRFVERLLEKYPDSIPLRILTGHSFLMHQNYDYALDQYGHVYKDPMYTNNPSVNLFMGISSLQKAMLRRTPDRHHGLMRAFAFFQDYYR